MRTDPPPGAPRTAVLLVGTGYGALKAAEDLAQSGVPIVWVTKHSHFLKLPGGIESFQEWPDDLNFQFRPLYLRVTRHDLVTRMTQAHVESLERAPGGYRAVIVEEPIAIDYDLCTGCGRCMEVCPLHGTSRPPLTRTPAYCPSRALDLEKRTLSPCRMACPLGVNVQAYMALTAAGRFDEALGVIREDNPLPGICGRVCHHPCEASCRRAELDEAVAIRDIKRFLTDCEAQRRPPSLGAPRRARRPERVAVVGSGPAGLTAAHFLNREGFPVTIFEAHREAGGMLRIGINAFRLPRLVLDAEIQALVAAGVEIRTGTRIDSIESLVSDGYRAVVLATGAGRDLRLGIPGEDSAGAHGAVDWLRSLYVGEGARVGKRVAVIGGGNSAIDAARAAIRVGAEEVTIFYRRERKDMPAHDAEIRAAEEEGIEIEYLVAPARLVAVDGKVAGLELVRIRLGPPDESGRGRPEPIDGSGFVRDADTVIAAIGQMPDLGEAGLGREIAFERRGRAVVDAGLATSREGVFAAGDLVAGPDTVIGSMAQGRLAAARAIEHLTREAAPLVAPLAGPRGVGDYLEFSDDTPRQWRPEMAQRQPKVRRRDFEEVGLGLTIEQAVAEAKRCVQCGSCCECRLCESVCADVGAIDHLRPGRRMEIVSPRVIVADDDEMPSRELLGEEGVYRLGDFQRATDLIDVLVAGSASAGKTMAECTALRAPGQRSPSLRGQPEVEARVGVFVCTCNGTMASQGALEGIRDFARGVAGVVASDLVFSACHPRGSDEIARAVRDQALSRVILASCVCCPLELQCISCNDQRNRARIHLFDRLGLERSRFEMINLRDHLGTGGESDDEVLERAREHLRAAFVRARFMGPLRQGVTKIGNRILVLGGSSVGVSAAMNLDLQGFQVRLVHRCRLKVGDGADLPEAARERAVDPTVGRSISHVEEAIIEAIHGHMGDFTVAAREGGARRRWRADIVCLTDDHVLPLAVHEDMMGLKKFYRYDFAFFHTPQMGLYRVMPRTLKRVSAFQAGAALAAQVAKAAAEAFLKDHELSPRVDSERCRGCGRCADICPFDAIKLVENRTGFFTAEVLRHNCVGCGGCVGRCPVTAMDMPYFSNQLLEEIVAGTLAGDG